MRWSCLLLLAGCDWFVGLVHVPPADARDARDALVPIDAADAPDGPKSTGLVAYWTMDTISAGTVVAAIGGHDGSCGSCPTAAAGMFSGALAFDGMSNEVHVDVESSFALPQFTITAWLNLAANTAGYKCPLNKVLGTSGADSWQLCVIDDAELDFISSGSSDLFSGMASELQIGAWTFVAMRYDGTTKSLVMDATTVGSIAPVTVSYDTGAITFGADEDNTGIAAYFDGAIDDVRIYDHELSGLELAAVRTGAQ